MLILLGAGFSCLTCVLPLLFLLSASFLSLLVKVIMIQIYINSNAKRINILNTLSRIFSYCKMQTLLQGRKHSAVL